MGSRSADSFGGRGRAVNRKWAPAVSRPQVGSGSSRDTGELRSEEGVCRQSGRPVEAWQVMLWFRG